MSARVMLFLLLLFPLQARAQLSLTVTELQNSDGTDAEAHEAACSRDTCRATLPVRVDDDVCVLNVRLGVPERSSKGRVMFAFGPCQSRAAPVFCDASASVSYDLDEFGATSMTLPLSFLRRSQSKEIIGMECLSQPPAAFIRLDIVATTQR